MMFCVPLISCQSLLSERVKSPTPSLSAIKDGVVDPVRKGNETGISLFKSAREMVDKRVRPATTVTGKKQLTLHDCRSLALANNLDLRVSQFQELAKRSIEYSAKTKMLPNFLVSTELAERDNIPYTYSDQGGLQGYPPTFSGGGSISNWAVGHERNTFRVLMETNWSPTDSALAYYLSRSSVNERMRAHYQRVRVAQKVLGVVDASYFRLLSLQDARPKAERLVQLRSRLIQDAEQLFERKLINVEDYHRHRRNLGKARNLKEKLINDIQRQRNLLASALALSPDTCVDGFCVIGELCPPIPVCASEFEMAAIRNRPEAIQSGLNHLNSVNDYKRTLVKYIPRFNVYWRQTYDKDKYQYNSLWRDVGGQLQFDFVQWVSNLNESNAARTLVASTETEIGNVAIGIASQVRTAVLAYLDAVAELKRTQDSLNSSNRVIRIVEQRLTKNATDKISVDEARADTINDEIEQLRALGEVNATLAELNSATGVNYNEPSP
jgi:outer membrane protein TolC